eukprot:TRINITY_DN16026_c0_g1_i1.p1 TRINITY_DN16026_c0_g1~~TRINITY_DN16026_c0_g1_i1.p1  ORF type:complete len:241 (-),score=39.31 TRINITY_DN16026_c0_g1_i1:67-789(-)
MTSNMANDQKILRVCINFGNVILAQRDEESGEPKGISVDLGNEMGNRLGLDVKFLTVDGAAKSVAAVSSGEADVGFFAIDPLRGQEISFSSPYIFIEGNYLVRGDSSFHSLADVDKAGVRVVVGKGSAYDLHLSRTLKEAEMVRCSSSQEVVETMVRNGYEVAAGVKQMVQAEADRLDAGLRLINENFMVIRQAVGIAKSRPAHELQFYDQFIRDAVKSGFVAASVQRHRVQGASIANYA